MSLPVILTAGLELLKRVIPDPETRRKAEYELLKLNQEGALEEFRGHLQMAQMQADTNKQEAGHQSLFVAGWRPAIGWACGAIFACNYIGVPFLAWLSPLLDLPPPPRLDIGEVLPVLLGMLGLGGLRTTEKLKGKA